MTTLTDAEMKDTGLTFAAAQDHGTARFASGGRG